MITSVRSVVFLGFSAMALAGPAAADGTRIRRPRDDAPRERRDRRDRDDRPEDGPRLRDGMYGDTAGAYGEDIDECTTTLLDAVAADEDLSTLGAAVSAAGLEGALSDASVALTVLAPTDDAFGDIDPDTLTALLGNPEELAGILTLHVIEGDVFAEDLSDGMVVATLSGGELTVAVSDDGITFTSPSGVVSTVVNADIEVCSSVVHVIDSVLLP